MEGEGGWLPGDGTSPWHPQQGPGPQAVLPDVGGPLQGSQDGCSPCLGEGRRSQGKEGRKGGGGAMKFGCVCVGGGEVLAISLFLLLLQMICDEIQKRLSTDSGPKRLAAIKMVCQAMFLLVCLCV